MSEPNTVYRAGSFSDEDAHNGKTDKYDLRKIKVPCPKCSNVAAPLCSRRTKLTGSGMQWVGCSHKEPYSHYETTCRRCKATYTFSTYTPQ